MATLPEDLVIEILSRLPVESVVRFKCVCKSWYTLINHSKFVKKHTSNSLNHNHILFLPLAEEEDEEEDENNINFTLKLITYSLDGSESAMDLSFPFDNEDCVRIDICGHSHGLICLADSRNDIFLCNPTTKEFQKLPPSILHLIEPLVGVYDSYTNAVGFGYDPKSKDFKVVRIVHFVIGFALLPSLRKTEIYDLSEDRWREIESPIYGDVIKSTSFVIYNQGNFYWWAEDVDEARFILSFDMSEEVFAKISVPEVSENYASSMGVLNGSFVLFHYPLSGDNKSFHIWEMEIKDRFGGVSWSKIFTIGSIPGIKKPLLFVRSDELLLEDEEGQTNLYNIRTQHLKKLSVKGLSTKMITKLGAIFIIKSLVSVTGKAHIKHGF